MRQIGITALLVAGGILAIGIALFLLDRPRSGKRLTGDTVARRALGTARTGASPRGQGRIAGAWRSAVQSRLKQIRSAEMRNAR